MGKKQAWPRFTDTEMEIVKGADLSQEVVKSQLLKLDGNYIRIGKMLFRLIL